MAIIKTIGKSEFVDDFKKCRPDSFSYEGLQVLYSYLNDLSEDTGEDIELDIIALCGEYEEAAPEYFLTQYGVNSVEELKDITTVIEVNKNRIIIQSF